jgi:hypothetical protein
VEGRAGPHRTCADLTVDRPAVRIPGDQAAIDPALLEDVLLVVSLPPT